VAARDMTRALGGRWYGHYGIARCPAHPDKTPSLSLADGRDGRLLVRCHAGCANLDVLAFLRKHGMQSNFWPERPIRIFSQAPPDDEERCRKALRIWEMGVPIEGTLAEDYLAHRACLAPWPSTLIARAWCAEARSELPALAAAVVRGGSICAVHRTFLQVPGRKADVFKPRLMLGRAKGSAVPLSDKARSLAICEGLEDGLAVRDALPNVEVWAATSAPMLAAVEMPSYIRDVVIGADADAAGQKAAARLAEVCAGRGISCRIMLPPDGAKDFNEVAQRAAEAGVRRA